jgi:hypothetical protein
MRLFAGCDMALEATEPCPTVAMLRPTQRLRPVAGERELPVRPAGTHASEPLLPERQNAGPSAAYRRLVRPRLFAGRGHPGVGHQHIAYQYGVSTATTDALDPLNAGVGVCRDFSHSGISLCRALRIPARMVVGYLFQPHPMDLHAWFEAYIGGRWFTFDATQSQPRGGRIVVAYGRDAADVAFISNYGALTTKSLKAWVQLDNGQPLF